MKMHTEDLTLGLINYAIYSNDIDKNGVSDGYHTFGELYDHRVTIYIALCKLLDKSVGFHKPTVWRSKAHSDGVVWDGWFVLGINKEKGEQITYHLPISRWEETNFAETLDKAPEWDAHTSNDVLDRLKSL